MITCPVGKKVQHNVFLGSILLYVYCPSDLANSVALLIEKSKISSMDSYNLLKVREKLGRH
jgi:hypothetical protein